MIDVLQIREEVKKDNLIVFIKNGDIYIKDSQNGETMKIGEADKCKKCDKWKAGRFRDGLYCYSDEGYCTNWHTMTGENFFCGDFEKGE